MFKEYEISVNRKIEFLCGNDVYEAKKKIAERKKWELSFIPLSCMAGLSLRIIGTDPETSVIGAAALMLFLTFLYEYKIYSEAKKKKRLMRFELSEITERLAILLEAGVPLWNAFLIIAETGDEKKPLEAEIKKTVEAFVSENGYFYEPEKCFQDFAERTSDAGISTFVSLIVQNSRKGGGELSSMLRLQAVNQRTERRAISKQLADEASTLMVLPSVLILAAIMVLVAAPAVISFF